MNKQKILEQEKELRTLIQYTYGHNVYNEMIELRRKLKKQREDLAKQALVEKVNAESSLVLIQ